MHTFRAAFTAWYPVVLAGEYHSVDEAGFWDQVYKTQTERDIYEWYGLGQKLSAKHV